MTKAIILAAGMGTRLRPLTNDRPKCLVELAGQPILDHQTDVLRSLGISDIHVVGGYLAHKIQREGITLHLNQQYESTNMVYTLFTVAHELQGTEDVVVSYGDIVYEPSVLQKLLACEAEMCVVSDADWLPYWSAQFSNPLEDAETFMTDSKGMIRGLGKNPKGIEEVEGQFIGLLKFQHGSLPRLKQAWSSLKEKLSPREIETMYTTDFIQHLIEKGWKVKSVQINNGWAEIDSASDLEVAEMFFEP